MSKRTETMERLKQFQKQYADERARKIRETPWDPGTPKRLLSMGQEEINNPDNWDDELFAYASRLTNIPLCHLLKNATLCGCYDCGSIFPPNKLKRASDYSSRNIEPDYEAIRNDVGIVLCPYCIDDTVIYDAPGIPLNKEFLRRMHRGSFSESW